MTKTYRFPDRDQAEHFAATRGGVVQYAEVGATLPGLDDYRPYVVVPVLPVTTPFDPADRDVVVDRNWSVDTAGRPVNFEELVGTDLYLASADYEADRAEAEAEILGEFFNGACQAWGSADRARQAIRNEALLDDSEGRVDTIAQRWVGSGYVSRSIPVEPERRPLFEGPHPRICSVPRCRAFATTEQGHCTVHDHDPSTALVERARAFVDTNSFVASVVGQYDRKGTLSSRQEAALARVLDEIETLTPVRVQITNAILDGTYTAVFEDGSYRTFKIEAADDWRHPGIETRFVSLLTGRDNEGDFSTIGEVVEGGYVKIWRRYVHEESTILAGLRVICGDPLAASKAYGLRSKHCGICGHKLSTPTSVERGIGPDCVKKFGGA